MKISALPDKILISGDVLFKQVGAQYVLLDIETEQYFGLDEVGARFWKLVSDEGDTQSAFEQLLTEYEVDAVTLRQDLIAFLNKLERANLITIENQSTGSNK